jgi:hypothetical protein
MSADSTLTPERLAEEMTPERLAELERKAEWREGSLAYIGFEGVPLLCASLRAAWAERDRYKVEVGARAKVLATQAVGALTERLTVVGAERDRLAEEVKRLRGEK